MRTPVTLQELPAYEVRSILGPDGLKRLHEAFDRGCAYLPGLPPNIFLARTETPQLWVRLNPERRTATAEANGLLGLYRFPEGQKDEIWVAISGPKHVELRDPVKVLWHELRHCYVNRYHLPDEGETGAERWEATPPTLDELRSFAKAKELELRQKARRDARQAATLERRHASLSRANRAAARQAHDTLVAIIPEICTPAAHHVASGFGAGAATIPLTLAARKAALTPVELHRLLDWQARADADRARRGYA